MQEKPPFINFNLLIFMSFSFCFIITELFCRFDDHNHVKYSKILIIWFLVKALILLINVPYIKATYHKIVEYVSGDRADLTTTKVIRNTYLTYCIVSEMALPIFLMFAL